jgi:hypothetical protein
MKVFLQPEACYEGFAAKNMPAALRRSGLGASGTLAIRHPSTQKLDACE